MNENNTVIITTTLPNNSISEKRRNNMIQNFSAYKIPIMFNHGIKDKNMDNRDIMATIVKNAIESYKKTTFDYGLICDDDFCPAPNFLEELNKTVALLPPNWRALHLCPGYLWGRAYRDMTKIGHLNPEYNMDGIPYHESGRFYMNCNNQVYVRKNFWLGGPIAVLLNKKNVDNYLQHFLFQYTNTKLNNDVIFTLILTPDDYVCREPLLGYENEEGGTTFHNN
jgi:hypothetical protein